MRQLGEQVIIQVNGREFKKPQERTNGVVVSNKMDKTIVVAEKRKVMQSIYGNSVNRTPKFYAHDENDCNVGDTVKISKPVL